MKHAVAVIAVVVWMASVASPAWGQWTGGPTGPIYYNGGNVGIGTQNPQSTLDVTGTLWWGAYSGLLGGDANGQIELGPRSSSSATPYIDFHYGSGSPQDYNVRLVNDGNNRLDIVTASNGPVLTVNTGKVGIGTTNPQYLLSVDGTLGTKEVIVTNTGWSDYVFERGYRLRPLNEVKAYIQANHHLPDIPSAVEVKKRGVSVGEMQSKLLAKIEELTLHMIAAEEKNERLRKMTEDLQRENLRIREQMARLAAREGNLIR